MNGSTALPRELISWLDSLDLAYSVRNVRRDLANGFVVAEILSRYHPMEVNIYTFDNGQKIERRKDNWEQIRKILVKKGFTLSAQDYEPIMNQAPDAAFEFIKKLYEFEAKRKLNTTKKPKPVRDEDDEENFPPPAYMKPTGATLARDRELTRIVDLDEREARTRLALYQHEAQVRVEKQNSNIKEYLTFKKRQQLEEQLRKEEELILERKRKYNTNNNMADSLQPEVREIQLRSYNSSTSKKNKEQQGQLMEAKGILDFLQDQCSTLFKKEPIAADLAVLHFDEKRPSLVADIFSRCEEVRKRSLRTLVESFNENNLELIVETVNNNFLDFKKFFLMFIKPLTVLKVGSKTTIAILSLFKRTANALVESDAHSTQTMFHSILLVPLLEIIAKQPTKKAVLCEIAYKFCAPNSTARLSLIMQIHSHLKMKNDFFVSILAQLITQPYDDDFDIELYRVFFTYALQSLTSPSPPTRVNALKILSELCLYDYVPVLEKIHLIHRLISDDWWEVKAQILIICENLLLYIAQEDPETEAKERRKQQRAAAHDPDIDEIDSEISQDIQEANNKRAERKRFLMDIVLTIFNRKESQNILRIGLIYLAPVLNYYQELCSRYLEILLGISTEIRESVLLTNPTPGEEEGQIVGGCNSFRYKLTSAPISWNSVGIALSLDEFVHNEKLSEFSKEHLEIIIGCLHNELLEQHTQTWIDIFNNLKKYIFLALLEREMCSLASQIIKRLFLFAPIQATVMADSHVLFLRLINFTYDPDIDSYCKENLLDLFEFLNTQGAQFKSYTYNLIKDFSEQNKEKFLRSNLVEFMNTLARQRREEQFPESISF